MAANACQRQNDLIKSSVWLSSVVACLLKDESGSEKEGDGLEIELRVRALKSMQAAAAQSHDDDSASDWTRQHPIKQRISIPILR